MMPRMKDLLMTPRSALLSPLLLTGALLAGCPGGGAEIVVAPTSIEFGDVVVGTSVAQSIEVTNTGSAKATLTFDLEEGAPFSVALTGAIEIQPQDSRLIFVEALPLSTGTDTTVLSLS